MFLDFFINLKKEGLPVSLHEYLTLLEGLKQNLGNNNLEDFYYLSKTILVKHEAHLDTYDQVFGHYFKGLEAVGNAFFEQEIPAEWLEKNLLNNLSEEEKAMIEKMGGLEELMKRFKELQEEQDERHEGGNKWIGTGGTSPFGANGFNPEGFRMGQETGRNGSAIKVWDKRRFENLDDSVELDTRNIKLALKRLRVFTREGNPDELDLVATIKKTSENAGILDIHMVPAKKNRVKVLMLFDIGGSMDGYIETCSKLFSAAKHEFKHLEFYYFHNCLYEYVWKDNTRRWNDRIPTWDLLHKYNSDYKVIFVGDAAMSPYEVIADGGSSEHYNKEAGVIWLQRMKAQYNYMSWINPTVEKHWNFYESTKIIREVFDKRMFPMTIEGISQTMKSLRDKKVDYKLDTDEAA